MKQSACVPVLLFSTPIAIVVLIAAWLWSLGTAPKMAIPLGTRTLLAALSDGSVAMSLPVTSTSSMKARNNDELREIERMGRKTREFSLYYFDSQIALARKSGPEYVPTVIDGVLYVPLWCPLLAALGMLAVALKLRPSPTIGIKFVSSKNSN